MAPSNSGRMMNDAITVSPSPNHLVMWVGTISEGELDSYLHETHPFGRTGPRSLFAADIMCWYDQDYVEAYVQTLPANINDLMAARGITEQALVAEAEARCSSIGPVTCFIL